MLNKANVIINSILIFLTVVCWFIAGLVFYWGVLDRNAPVIIGLGEVTPNIVKSGDEVIVRWDVYRLRACFVRVERILEGIGVNTPSYPISYSDKTITIDEVGRSVDLYTRFNISTEIIPGEYLYYNKLIYKCNPMQEYFPIILSTPKAYIRIYKL